MIPGIGCRMFVKSTDETIKYGLLYNGYAVIDTRNICAEGFHIPTETELLALVTDASSEGNNLKVAGLVFWDLDNGNNSLKFNAKGNGYRRNTDGVFLTQRTYATIWSSTALSTTIRCMTITSTSGSPTVGLRNKIDGAGIRPLKDSTTLSDGEEGTYTGNDGKTYKTICINGREWVQEFIQETEYQNGDTISEVTDASTWIGLSTGALCAYDNDWGNV